MTGASALHNLDSRIADIADGLEIVAIRRLGDRDDASDAVQETLARLLDRVQSGAIATDGELAPVAWGIARHVITDMLRERQRKHAVPDDVTCSRPGPLDALVSADDAAAVRRALQRLSADDQALLRRCFEHGERIGAIAAELGEPPERLRKRKSRALQRLAELLPNRSTSHETAPQPMENT